MTFGSNQLAVGCVRQGSYFFVYMPNTPNSPLSRLLLETATEAMDSLIEGASEFCKSFIIIQRLHDDKGLPVDDQRIREMSDLIHSLRKMLYDERASLQLQLSAVTDAEEAERVIAELKAKAEAGRTPQK